MARGMDPAQAHGCRHARLVVRPAAVRRIRPIAVKTTSIKTVRQEAAPLPLDDLRPLRRSLQVPAIPSPALVRDQDDMPQ